MKLYKLKLTFVLISFAIISQAQTVKLVKKEPINLPSYPHYLIHLKFNFNQDYSSKDKIYLFNENDTTRIKLDTNDCFTFLAEIEKRKFNLHVPIYGNLSFNVKKPSSQVIYHFVVNCRDSILDLPEVRYDFGKPVIYMYSDKEIEAEVDLNFSGKIDFTYPIAVEGKWNCTVKKDGQLEVNGQTHNYLFWEGKTIVNPIDISQSDAITVKTDTLIAFFENTLRQLNFNSSERDDFITYWGPKMIQNKYVNILFWTNEYENYAQLNIKPQPDHISRFFMVWSKAEESNYHRKALNLKPFNRSGFHVLEWGGTEVDQLMFNEHTFQTP